LSGELSSITKYIFLLTFIIQIIFGVWFFVSPESWVTLTGWPNEVNSGRVLGAVIMALALGALLAYRATSWEQVELFVIMQLLYNLLGLVAMLWNYATVALPVAGWLIIGLLALYLVFYLFVYYKAKQ
jgi:Ca2+/Na+ antiporter